MSEQTSPTSSAIPAWTLGWRLQRALGHADMTTSDMADELGVGRSTISRWINDHGTPPRSGFIKLWALRTGVPATWLATGAEEQDGPDDGGSVMQESSSACTRSGDGVVVVMRSAEVVRLDRAA